MNLATDAEQLTERVLKAKQIWLDWAEIVDAYRLVPRAVLFMLAHLVISLSTTMVFWYIHLPGAQRSNADAAAVCSIIAALCTLFGAALKFYIDNGRKWVKDPA